MATTVWNAADKGANVSLRFRSAVAELASAHAVRATPSWNAGKLYFQVLVDAIAAPQIVSIGVALAAASVTASPGSDASAWVYRSNGTKLTGGASVAYGAAYVAGDTIGVGVDFVTGEVTFFKNGVSQGVAYTLSAGATLFPIAGAGSADPAIAAIKGEWMAEPPAYAVPSGYKAWDTGPSTHKVLGIVSQNGAKVARTLRAYHAANGKLLAEATSSPSNGAYTLELPSADPVFVLAVPAATYVPLSRGPVTPDTL